MSHVRLAAWGGIALSFALSVALYSRLPATVPTYYGWHGPAIGEAARPIAAFKWPVLGLISYVVTRIKLRRQGASLDILPLALVGLFLVLHVITLRAVFDPDLEAGRLISICASAFVCVFGNYLGKVRRNRWLGIRTPWTLSSDEVWLRTHRLGARLYMVAGALSLCAVSAGAPPPLGHVLLIAASAIAMVYSYFVSRQRAG